MRQPIYYHTRLDGSFPEIAAVLGGPPETFLPPPATPVDGGVAVDLRADRLVAVPEVRAIVTVTDPPVEPAPDLLIRPLMWRAAGVDSLFPVLVADLELVALGEDRMRLALVGFYRPPLSVVGVAADRLLGRHVAEAVVRHFVMDVADRLVEASTLAA